MKTWFYELDLPEEVHAPAYLKAPDLQEPGKELMMYRWGSRPDEEAFADSIVDLVLEKLGERLASWVKSL